MDEPLITIEKDECSTIFSLTVNPCVLKTITFSCNRIRKCPIINSISSGLLSLLGFKTQPEVYVELNKNHIGIKRKQHKDRECS